LEEEVRG